MPINKIRRLRGAGMAALGGVVWLWAAGGPGAAHGAQERPATIHDLAAESASMMPTPGAPSREKIRSLLRLNTGAGKSLDQAEPLPYTRLKALNQPADQKADEPTPAAKLPADPAAKPPADPAAKPPADPAAKPPADPAAKPPADPAAKPPADPAAKVPADQAGAVLEEFRAELDSPQVHLDSGVNLTVEMIGKNLYRVSAPVLPPLADFDVINMHSNEHRTQTGSRMLQIRQWHYSLVPKKVGTFKLPPASIQFLGRTLRTASLEIEVLGPRSGFGYQRKFGQRPDGRRPNIAAALPEVDAERLAGREAATELFAHLSPKHAFINQQVLLTVSLRYEDGPKVALTYNPPPLTGFYSEELPMDQKEESVADNRTRYIQRQYRLALFPLQPGVLTVGAAQVKVSRPGVEQSFLSDPLQLNVKALPKDPGGDPDNALVGQYTLTAALASPAVMEDAPVRLTLTLKGRGNVRAAPIPRWFGASGFRVQAESMRENLSSKEQAIFGERIYQYLLVPRRTGVLPLGKAEVRYFDPQAERWTSALAALPELKVLPRPREQQVQAPVASTLSRLLNLRPYHAGSERLRHRRGHLLFSWEYLAGLGAGVLGLALLALGRWTYLRRLADPAARREVRALKDAQQSLRRAAVLAAEGKGREFYDLAAKALTDYLSAKLLVPAAQIVQERVPDLLRAAQVPQALADTWVNLLQEGELVRFAAGQAQAQQLPEYLLQAGEALLAFERFWKIRQAARRQIGKKKRTGPSGPATALLLASLLGAAVAQAGEEELHLLRGNTLAESGLHTAALAEYQQVVQMGVEDADLFYNLGNAYVHTGQIGRAVLAYERARLLAPRDGDIRHNLAETVSLVSEPEGTLLRPEQALLFLNWYAWFTGDELAAAAGIFFGLALALAAFWILGVQPLPKVRAAFFAAALAAVVFLAWSGLRSTESAWWPRAVVIAPTAEVRGRPYSGADVLHTLAEGVRVRILRREEAWLEVEFGRNQHGWVSRSSMGIIE